MCTEGTKKTMEQQLYRYWLARLNNIGNKKIDCLIRVLGNEEEIFKASRDSLYALHRDGAFGGLLHDKDLETILVKRDMDGIIKDYQALIGKGIRWITREEEEYPSKLRHIYGAPYGLYIKGSLPKEEERLIAVVGARECSGYGMEMAAYLSGAIAREGISIISGLARGVDTFSHKGALEADGITYAVLGCGIDICYPRENINYYMEMQKKGGIISEYAPNVRPLSGNFPMRNRIISGLSDGILVIEAKEKSGSLITVDYGLEQGKEIYALPGRATDRLSEGCNNLIRMGAKLVTSPEDILEELISGYQRKGKPKKCSNDITPTQEHVLLCLNFNPKHLEEIIDRSGMPVEVLMEQLLQLELMGRIRQPIKNCYSIVLE